MKHYDQHIIELYVLGSKKVEEIRGDIESHLAECYTCRGIARELTEFYQMAGGDQPLLPERAESNKYDSLVIRPEYRPTYEDRGSIPMRIWRSARAHPVASSIFSVGTLALILWAWNVSGLSRDTNPDNVSLNASYGALVVYNKGDEILWQIPQRDVREPLKREDQYHVRYSCVADINGDGRKEVLTTLPLPDEEKRYQLLRAFDSKRNIVLRKALDDRLISFRGQRFDAGWDLMYPFVLENPKQKAKEILVAGSNGRSPTFVARLDDRGNVIGRYWHYGQLGAQYLIDLNGDGKKQLLLCGVSDVGEGVERPNSVIIVLDPGKIVDETESLATRGFGFEGSYAELYYIQLPQSDLNAAMGTRIMADLLESQSEDVLRFSAVGKALADLSQFEFIFSKDLRIIEVKSSAGIDDLHAKLKKEGKISSVLDDKYLADMKHRVKYWNGQSWVSEHTKVNQSPDSSRIK